MKKAIISGLILLFLSMSNIYAKEPYAGQYELIRSPQLTNNPNKVEVVVLFWYTCPHCDVLDNDYLKPWAKNKPDYVELTAMPAVFQYNQRIPLAKAYYTAEALDVLDKTHRAFFQAIHDQKRQMGNEKAIRALFVKHGVSVKDFAKTYHGFYVDSKIRQAKAMTKNYGINSVPIIIVNGKYRLSSVKAKGYVNLMKILSYLIEKERNLSLGYTH
ncbi:MAG: thiol:disulfide interchange protein DsbA/DsbL [Thiotrichaceae bacterium]|nr:thiol:disulfide interchange protein DsbA/DsbL [Thiotrichaceae bacterium]